MNRIQYFRLFQEQNRAGTIGTQFMTEAVKLLWLGSPALGVVLQQLYQLPSSLTHGLVIRQCFCTTLLETSNIFFR